MRCFETVTVSNTAASSAGRQQQFFSLDQEGPSSSSPGITGLGRMLPDNQSPRSGRQRRVADPVGQDHSRTSGEMNVTAAGSGNSDFEVSGGQQR